MNQPLYTCTLALSFLASSALAQSSAPAQKPQGKRVPMAQEKAGHKMAKGNFHRHEEIIGMDLWTMANDDKTDLGDLSDFVVDTQNGEISHVVISSGGIGSIGDTLRVIEFDDIQWSENEEGEPIASVKHTEERFKAIPSFEKKDLGKLVGRGAVEASAKRLKDATKDMDKEAADKATGAARDAATKGVRHHFASDITGLDIYGPKEEKAFSEVGSLVLNCDNGNVAFVTVEANDEDYLVPFTVFDIKPVMSADKKAEVTYAAYAPVNAEGMVGAPTINEEEKHTAENPRFRAMVAKHYGVEPAGRKGMKGMKGMKGEKAEMEKEMKRGGNGDPVQQAK